MRHSEREASLHTPVCYHEISKTGSEREEDIMVSYGDKKVSTSFSNVVTSFLLASSEESKSSHPSKFVLYSMPSFINIRFFPSRLFRILQQNMVTVSHFKQVETRCFWKLWVAEFLHEQGL